MSIRRKYHETIRNKHHSFIHSFNLVKTYIGKLYEMISDLQSEVAYLRRSHYALGEKVANLSKRKTVSKVKKVIAKVRKTKVTFMASKTVKKFHNAKCAFAKNIKPKNKVRFVSKNTALNQGFKGCACIA